MQTASWVVTDVLAAIVPSSYLLRPHAASFKSPLPELPHQLLSEVPWEAHRGTGLG